MTTRILLGLLLLVSLIQGLAPDAIPGTFLPIILVILGLAYAATTVSPDDAVAYLVLTLAVGVAASANVLSAIPAIGASLDAIVDQVSIALYAGIIAVLSLWMYKRTCAPAS